MKKIIAVLLSLLLVSNVAVIVLLFQNNRLLKENLENSQKAVFGEEENPEQNEGHNPSEPTGNTAELIRVVDDKFLTPPNDWIFEFNIHNNVDCDLYIEELIITDNGGENEFFANKNERPELLEMMMGPDFETTPLRPGDVMQWNDAHPGENLTDRTYQFVFRGADGNAYTATYEYNLIMEFGESYNMNADYSADSGKDLLTLRHDADFGIEVFDGVYWVPVSSLGKSRFENREISDLIGENPETKQAEAKTLYEALQIYQIGGFAASDDNVRISENGINWEHHKPGYNAVLTNNGCCATSANWLNYILKDDYDEVGFIATSQRDGSGHIYNYIKEDGWYYFIDLTHYRTDWVATAAESGNLDDYYSSDFVLGNLHKTKSVESFVNYVQQAFGDPPGMMFKYTAENCMAIDSRSENGEMKIIYEALPDIALEVIFDDPNDNLGYYQTDPPKDLPNW